MKVLSLFSGVGGFDMGLENAGMQTVFQCEWDKHANTILNKHWPHVPKWEDVSTLTGKHILTHAPVIDVVAWGSPCQDLSVAGKRGGLEGERSGLFHEGIRIIKELRKETNGQYPRISIWENVVGALNSNRGADFGIIINEMAEAGALVIEWAVLDAQYFGVPQRRRRVFVIAIFDPVLAERCPSPLLPVAESLPGHLAKGKPARKSSASKTATSVGADGQWAAGTTVDGDILRTSVTSKWHKGSGGPSGSEYYNMVVENGILGSEIIGSLNTSDAKMISNQYVNENKCVVEPVAYHFDALSSNSMKSSNPDSGVNEVDQARTLDTWRPDPSLNQGGLAIVEPFVKSSRAQTADDSETWVEGAVNPTLNSFDQGDVRATTAIVFENSYRDGARIANDGVTQTLSAKMGTGGGNTPMLAFDTQFGSNANVTENIAPTLKSSQAPPSVAYPIQDGRDIEKHQNGLGVGDEHSPAYTIDQTGAQAVAYGIQGSMIGRQDHNGPGGRGVTEEDGPMFTLTGTDVHAVSQEEPTVFQPGTMVRLNGGVWEGTVPTLRAESKRGDNEPHIQIHNAEPTMAVRRLTPLECERLMGWPDHHTRYKADGTEQADTNRYRQCGNGVASPVAQWIAKHLLKLEEQQ
jgi:DNA (cytosine-5)-methyltransferase 1